MGIKSWTQYPRKEGETGERGGQHALADADVRVDRDDAVDAGGLEDVDHRCSRIVEAYPAYSKPSSGRWVWPKNLSYVPVSDSYETDC